MRISLQHSFDNPQNWVDIDHTEWPAYVSAVKRPLPVGGEMLNTAGYLNCLSVMGLYGDGDHYAIEPFGVDGVRMSLWYDDMDDINAPGYERIGPGERAIVWTFEPMRPIAAKGDMWQPRLTRTVIGSPDYLAEVQRREQPAGRGPPRTCSLDATQYIEWANWQPPPEALTLHGIWMPDALHDDHQTIRSPQSWREWTDGVPAALCQNGRLVSQRDIGRYVKPDGTITWFLLDAAEATGAHTAFANEVGLSQTNPASAVGLASGNYSSGDDQIDTAWTSPSGEPGTATWPTGDYRCQIDVSAAGTNLSFGFETADTASGHFARVDSGLTADQTTNQSIEGLQTGIAIHLFTTGSVSWGSPSSSDRWECLLAITRSVGLHGNQAITVDVDQADSFTDGPWTVADLSGDQPYDDGGVHPHLMEPLIVKSYRNG
ncbi:MAG: hypothetical protein V3W44_08615 [Dehalococcoidales bacterium]